ncbi:MAG TPA: ATP-binding protein [Planctomycetota bacterium]|nr:ATP-binding protein [Planctomycetota bacterium]
MSDVPSPTDPMESAPRRDARDLASSAIEKASAPASAGEHLAIRLAFSSSPSYLPLLRLVARWICERSGLSELETHRTLLALVEAATNIIKHAYCGEPTGEIEVELRELREPRPGVELVLLDRGKFVALSDCQGRDLADLRPGGLGLHMMDHCLDEVRCEAREGGGSRLVLVKRAHGGDGSFDPCARRAMSEREEE